MPFEGEINPEVCVYCVHEINKKEFEEARNFKDQMIRVVEAEKDVYSWRKREAEIPCSCTTTVGELKLLIYQDLDIVPYKQQLYYDKKYLDNDTLSLLHYGVTPLKSIEIQKGISVMTEPTMQGPREKEIGFAGTFLSSTVDASEKKKSPHKPEKPAEPQLEKKTHILQSQKSHNGHNAVFVHSLITLPSELVKCATN